MRIELDLPDALAAALERSGLPAATLCERALEQAVARAAALRSLDATTAAASLPLFTARARTAVTLAFERGGAAATSTDVLHGLVTEGKNLAVRLLPALGVDPAALPQPDGTDDPGTAAAVVELAQLEAAALGHNYVGGEHLLLGLLAEPDGRAGQTLRAQGVDLPGARAAVVAALTGFTHARATDS
ncbi:Clp protease N-terminal domain-containing protein [Dactylosporangium matsuzakiense]|uniref:Clp R domain-containing protein n=1 Tax=Dactylosporangium matsuzakiense TaxID=53360 RepID=A0A9W6NSD0_9ACTN|nr:Clp protease N-terminal domain-containing protein [Dactylosporangium matsuzakiense]UWZ41698.1 ATP-dependent Clp protease ATP-binding subunit [Dactylosporangium matsuzakiense]GLL07363.1 hypothetical protein GCM10017581_091150 [Dactylosporangium matsuzakiense]